MVSNLSLVFRVMWKDSDGFPTLSRTSRGVCSPGVSVDAAKNV